MHEDDTTAEPVDVSADEEWKQRVREENAALDEKLAKESEKKTDEAGEAPTDDETPSSADAKSTDEAKPADEARPASGKPMQFPPADFSIVVSMFSTQAMVALGVIPNPATGKPDVQLELARHLIDLIGVLEEKTKGNLDSDEAGMIDATLHHLRMSFLEQSRAAKS